MMSPTQILTTSRDINRSQVSRWRTGERPVPRYYLAQLEQSARPPLLAVLGERRQCDASRESGANFAEQTTQSGPKGIRPNRYGNGDEHDQQGVLSRCGAPLVPVKTIDQTAHLALPSTKPLANNLKNRSPVAAAQPEMTPATQPQS
jgi:hypothetical protein